jgi:hypothetical protein
VREKFLFVVKKGKHSGTHLAPPSSNLNEKFFNEIAPSFSITSLSVIVTFLITAGWAGKAGNGREKEDGEMKVS